MCDLMPNSSPRIKTAIIGVGNCASSLVQGISYCRIMGDDAVGVSFPQLAGYRPQDIEIVAAFDVDARKVGKPLSAAIFASPNCTTVFCPDVAEHAVEVSRGPDLDGISAFMKTQPAEQTFLSSPEPELSRDQVIARLKEAGAEVMQIFLPVGSCEAVEFYANCALEAGCAVVNGIPVFLASNPVWAQKFEAAGLPILGDDFKAQFGATIIHRALADLAARRGVKVTRTYQLNVGGNTDFLNMMDGDRLAIKRESKTESVQAAIEGRLPDGDIRIGPSDHVAWLKDRKVAFIRLEGQLFGGVPTSVELRLEVEDSPNAAAESLAAIRCARIALDRGLKGAIDDASAFLFKHPPVQLADGTAYLRLLAFANGSGKQT